MNNRLIRLLPPYNRPNPRGGQVTDSTLISPEGVESWKSAAEYPELRHYFDIAGQKAPAAPESDVEEHATVSRARLITYLALAGLTGGWVMMVLGPLCRSAE